MNLNDAIFSEHYSVKVVYLSGYSKNQTVAFWLFSRILGQYEQAKQSGFSALSLARAVIEKSALPTVFSEDTSVELISHMADNLNSLVLTHNLINHKEPVQQLDKVHPTWRSEFPIPLDDETGTHF